MNKKLFFILIFALFLVYGCFDSRIYNKSQKKLEAETQKIKPLFNAVDLLGKKPLEVDKILGKSFLITGKSKSNPTRKSRWRWYKYKKSSAIKEISVFIDKDTEDNMATSITILFNTELSDSLKTASMFGIDLKGQKPIFSKTIDNTKEYRYEINAKAGKLVFYLFRTLDNSPYVDDTVRIFYKDS